jgi:hypothetical protein
MKRTTPFLLAAAAIVLCVMLGACSEDESPAQPKADPDYFPFSRTMTWTYKTNVLAEFGYPETSLDMKIDTLTTQNGLHYWIWVRIPALPDWAPLFAVLDSGNVVYTIGDHPPEEAFPLFRHKYLAGEAVSETISVQGKTYNTLRYELTVDPGGKVTWWFADGIGLVKEYSEDGISIFSGDMISGVALTELVSYKK